MMKYWSVFRCAAQTRFAYHRDILLRNIFFFILIYIFYRLWFVLNQSGILSERYSYVQLVWYVIITQSLIGAFATLKGIVDLEIQSGRIGVMLIRPYNYLLYHLCEFLGKTVVMLINNFLIGVVFGWVVVGTPPLSFVQVVLFVPVCLLSLLLYFFVEFLIALLAFWTENTPPFFWFYQKIVFFFGGLLIPIEYYPSILKLVSQYLPFQYMLYFPAKLFVGFDFSATRHALLVQCVWVLLSVGASWICFQRALRRIAIHGG